MILRKSGRVLYLLRAQWVTRMRVSVTPSYLALTRDACMLSRRGTHDQAYSPAGDPLRAGGEIANSQAIDSAARALRSPI